MRSRLVAAAFGLALVVACRSTTSPAASASPSAAPTAPAVTGPINVLAAASLTAAFKDEATAFQSANPGSTVNLTFAGSSTLATQIQNGAPGDVFASADIANMDKVAGYVRGGSKIFARNRLEIVVRAGNPKSIRGLTDLAKSGTLVVLCAPAVPCGKYAAQALTKAGVSVTPVSQELDVKAVVAKVAAGEADAGIVYVTDVRAGGSAVAGVAIPDTQNVLAAYPVAVLSGAANPAAAQAFVDFLRSPGGQAVLANYSFLGP